MSMAIAYNMKKRRMAEGGGVKGVHQQYNPSSKSTGTSLPGGHVRGAAMAREDKHGILKRPEETAQKREGMAKDAHHKVLGEMESMRDLDRTNLAEGGEVCPTCHGERYAEGGDNSGDEIGDAQEDDDRHDIVARIMRSRGKRDKNPRPA